ncbi:tetratricopeptide repeat-containing diguanylate cyclase [Thiolapillus sp.]
MSSSEDNNHKASLNNLLEEAEKISKDEPPRAIDLARQAIGLAKKTGAAEQAIRAHILLAQGLMYAGRYQETLDTALPLVSTEENDFPHLQAEALGVLGSTYQALGMFPESLEVLMRKRKILMEEKDKLGAADALHSIGVTYAKMEDHASSLENYMQAYRIKTEQDANPISIAVSLNNIGLAHRNLGNFEDALEAHQKSVRLMEQEKHLLFTGAARGNLAKALAALGRTEEAMHNFETALKIIQEVDSPYYLSEICRDFAEMEFSQKHLERALELGTRALEVARQTHSKPEIFKAHELLADIHEALGNPTEALQHLRNYHTVEKEVFNAESNGKIQGMRIRHDLEQTEKENRIYRLKNVELAQALEEARQLHEKLEKLSQEDQLTGLFNRRYLIQQLKHEFCRAHRNQQPLSVVLCDIDHFKRINDRWSHAMGDQVLKIIAGLLRDNVREGDLVARYGGEEFVLAFPQTAGREALLACENIRRAIEKHPWPELHPELTVTLSFGISDQTSLKDFEAMLHDADLCLYRAKHNGRNQCVYGTHD